MAVVLVIDDDQHIRYLLKVALEGMGHQIIEATNGKEALDAIQKTSPSLVIVDIFMPEMDGIELIRTTRRTNSDVKIIVISGNSFMKEIDLFKVAQRLGATHTLQKPFEIRALLDMVQALLPTESPPTNPI